MILTDLIQIWALKKNVSNPWDIYLTIELDERIDKQDLIGEIIRQCGALVPVYNTTDTFEFFTQQFFKREKDNIKRMIDLSEMEYNPLDNFERNENLSKKSKGKSTLDEDSTSNNSVDMKNVSKRSAFNEDLYQPDSEISDNGTNNNTETRDYTRNNEFESTDVSTVHGINGLVTRQDLIEKERKLLTFNVIKWIVNKYSMENFYQVF